MQTHVKILGMIHIIFSALGVLGAIILLALFGGLAGVLGTTARHGEAISVPLLGGIGAIIFVAVLAFSLPGLIIGIGLVQMRPWARVGGIVLSALELIQIPLGTVLGIYGLWTLLNRETEQLFQQQPGVARSAF